MIYGVYDLMSMQSNDHASESASLPVKVAWWHGRPQEGTPNQHADAQQLQLELIHDHGASATSFDEATSAAGSSSCGVAVKDSQDQQSIATSNSIECATYTVVRHLGLVRKPSVSQMDLGIPGAAGLTPVLATARQKAGVSQPVVDDGGMSPRGLVERRSRNRRPDQLSGVFLMAWTHDGQRS